MATRTTTVGLLTIGALAALTAATMTPAAAQGDPVAGAGNVYYLSGAYNIDGQAQAVLVFGNPDDEVFFGDWYGDGVDLPLVRRDNIFFVPDEDAPSVTAAVFSYGDAGDTVLVGDWDGDGVDSLAVRRGNQYFVKNDNQKTGVADRVFGYGDAGDTVLVGNWDGQLVAPTADEPGKGDTLMVRRGGKYFVKNDLTTGTADYEFYFGNPGDDVLVGDWNTQTSGGGGSAVGSGDGADQLTVRRGNEYFLSTEVADAGAHGTNPRTDRELYYGDPDDAVFVAAFPTPVNADGTVSDDYDNPDHWIEGDGFGVRRVD